MTVCILEIGTSRNLYRVHPQVRLHRDRNHKALTNRTFFFRSELKTSQKCISHRFEICVPFLYFCLYMYVIKVESFQSQDKSENKLLLPSLFTGSHHTIPRRRDLRQKTYHFTKIVNNNNLCQKV